MVPYEGRDEWTPVSKKTFDEGVRKATFRHTVEGTTPTQAFVALENDTDSLGRKWTNL
jgi:hypothetical protein